MAKTLRGISRVHVDTPRSNAKITTYSRKILIYILHESHAIIIHVVACYIVDFRSVRLSSRICVDLFSRVHVHVGTLYITQKTDNVIHETDILFVVANIILTHGHSTLW